MQYLTCTNDGCTAEDEVVTVTGHLRPCDRVLCTKCGQPMEIWTGDWRELESDPFRSRGVYA